MKSWLLAEQQVLIEQIHRKNLPHAIVLSGVSGAGKKELAHWLANALMCQYSAPAEPSLLANNPADIPCGQCKNCHLFGQNSHPDHLDVVAEGNHIGVDQIRQVSRFLEKTAQLGHNQVVVIDGAEMMTESAANALLKTLEEPTAHCYLLLLVKDIQHLLPTIVSRCRQLPLRPPVGAELTANLGKTSQDSFVNLSHFAELADPEIHQQYQQVVQQFISFLYLGQQRMALLTLLETSAHSVRWLEKIAVDLLRSHHQWQSVTLPPAIDLDKFSRFLHDKQDALYQVYQAINAYNKKVTSYSQFNQTFGLEKLLVEIQFIIDD
ncbi:DNA polymerase III subunit delta' [Thalassotalea insulae]|uniref:DNA-directed DNA polymerase n=1 Tax=Thalassotalea insulae TaxID=2056778 RepID=A0ABQ6GQ04_9GAMM|nr:DNA polymerase III subunit delta' [Thalassotalea insulae]GLX76790.1 DNA polymerase III subunit delta' [Thalassotalea insulae]